MTYWVNIQNMGLSGPIFRKLALVLLAFCLGFGLPLALVLAEEISDTDLAEGDVPNTDINDQKSDNDVPLDTEDQSVFESETQNEDIKDELKSNSNDLLRINTATKEVTPPLGQLKVNESMGSLNYEYNLAVPAGRSGLTPSLLISYNSNDRDNANWAGYGWSLSVPYIGVLNKKGVERMYQDKIFNSSYDDELVRVSDNEYQAKIEGGEFRKYIKGDEGWIMFDKLGRRYFFGQTLSSRQENIDDSAQVYRWYLEEIKDLNGNTISFSYEKDGGQIYPKEIIYTIHQDAPARFKVVFIWEDRPDHYTSYASAFEIKTIKRLKSIKILDNNIFVKEYLFDYISGDNGVRSLLYSIHERGLSDTGLWTEKVPTTFSYTSTTKTWHEDKNWWPVVSMIDPANSADVGVRFFDLNGDGYDDLYAGGNKIDGNYFAYSNTGTGWPERGRYMFMPEGFVQNGIDVGLKPVDFNGDLLSDLFYKRGPINGGSKIEAGQFVNNQGSFNSMAEPSLPVTMTGILSSFDIGTDYGVRWADMNGDGLVDIVRGKEPYSSSIHLNTGGNWSIASAASAATPFISYGRDTGTRLVDLNSDGLSDFISSSRFYDEIRSKILLNSGLRWTENRNWEPVIPFTNHPDYGDLNYADYGARFLDLNGDGLIDLLKSVAGEGVYRGTSVFLNTGSGWVQSEGWDIPERFSYNDFSDSGLRVVNLNGDGLDDLIASYTSGGDIYHVAQIRDGQKSDFLSEVKTSDGARIEIKYKPSTQYWINGKLANPSLPLIVDTVFKIIQDDGLGNEAVNEYFYEDGDYYFGDSFNRKFAGFGKVVKKDSVGNITNNYYHQGNDSASTLGEYVDHEAKIGRLYRIEKYGNNGLLYEKTINRWDRVVLPAEASYERSFVPLLNSLTMTYDGDAGHRDVAEAYTYDNFGNITRTENYGEVVASDDGNFNDIGSDKTTKILSYAFNMSANILGLVRMEEFRNNNNANVAVKKYYYDNQAIGSVQKGNLTKIESWVGSNKWITNTNIYNNLGLVEKTADGRGYASTYLYDEFYLYPIKIINPLGQTNLFEYNYVIGQPTKETDPNNFSKIKIYDGLGRVLTEKEQAGSAPAVVTEETSYRDDIMPRLVRVKKFLLPDLFTEIYSYFDGLGRPIQERHSMENANEYAVSVISYNSQGQISSNSLPYPSGGSNYLQESIPTSLQTEYTYDALGRPKSSTNIFGSTNYDYTDWVTTVTDPLGKIKKYGRDAYGRLILVDEKYGNGFYHTRYYYNSSGNLIRIIDALNNLRDFTYDNLGRRLSAQDLHQAADTTFGIWSYSYDDNSNLVSRKDPLGQTVNYFYDGLNRPLIEDYTGQTNPEVRYTYDNCINGVGRLCKVAIVGLSKYYEYTPRGEVRVDKKIYNLSSYTTVNAYDLAGNIISLRLPDNSEILYKYNRAGKVEKVSRRDVFNSSAIIPIVSNFDYGPHGLSVYQQNADGIKNMFIFDQAKSYRLQTKMTKKDNVNYQLVNYEYDPVGNITKIIDTSPNLLAKTVSYTYDDLYRLTKAVAVSASSTLYSQDFIYGPTGNILKGPAGVYGYSAVDYTSPQAATSIASSTYTYDKNGNMLTAPSATYTWDYNNRLIKSVTGATTTTYEYDNEGTRISQQSIGGPKTLYISPYYDLTGGTTIDKHIYADDRLVATLHTQNSTTTPYYVHTDHLNSTNLVTNGSGSVVQTLDYYPYGSLKIDQSLINDEIHKFTGHEFDRGSNLTYAGARYYNQDVGRWISQDPASRDNPEQFLKDPQQFNFYSYGRNNPLILFDPTGEKVEIFSKAIEKKSIGTHVFLLVTPDDLSNFKTMPSNWTVGAYSGNNGNLERAIDAPSDRSVVDNGYSVSPQIGYLKQRSEIQRPDGLSDTAFINNIMDQYDRYGDNAKYDAFARKGYNSNNFVSSLIINSGARLPWNGNARGVDPGYGKPIPNNYIKADGQAVSIGYSTISSYAGQQGHQAFLGKLQSTSHAFRGVFAKFSKALNTLKSR